MHKKPKQEKKRDRKKLRLDSCARFEEQLKKASKSSRYSLSLYVTGTTARSARAVANIRALCEEFLRGRYDLEVIDIYQQPAEVINAQIIAAPTLVKKLPKPLKRLIGDLSERDKVIVGLNLAKV